MRCSEVCNSCSAAVQHSGSSADRPSPLPLVSNFSASEQARPACAQCLKSAAQKGIPASEVRCEYSSRSIFFLAHGGDGTAPEGGDSAGADAVISGDKTKGKEGDKMDEMDDGE